MSRLARLTASKFRRFAAPARRRRAFGDYEGSERSDLEKIGTSYGGWFVPTDLLAAGSICYCVGAGEDVSFDVELARRFGCEVFIFDPTPRAAGHFELLRESTIGNLPTPINNDPDTRYEIDHEALEHLHFERIGVWDQNEGVRFYEPKDPAHVSHSAVNLQRTDLFFEAECRTVDSIMEHLAHEKLELLKLDVEGAEYRVLESMVAGSARPTVLCVEFDEGNHCVGGRFIRRIQATLSRLREVGYEPCHVDGWNCTMVLTERSDA